MLLTALDSIILGVANGIIIVGDVHLTSVKPSKRKDAVWMNVILDKLRQVVKIAKDNNYIIVFLGDIFDTPVESSEVLKTQFQRILSEAPHVSYTNVGNHDIKGDRLGDGDTLAMITETGYPLKAMKNNKDGGVFVLNGHRIGVGFTPYGMEIPDDVTGLFDDVESVLWFTHHDVAFDGRNYPNMISPFEIKGCDAVFNGHVHDRQDFIQVGNTCWMNFGSLTRMSVDAWMHQPIAVAVNPESEEGLLIYDIEVNRDAFDVSTRNIKASGEGDNFESKMGKIEELIQNRKEDPFFSDDKKEVVTAFETWLHKEKCSDGAKSVLMELALKSMDQV